MRNGAQHQRRRIPHVVAALILASAWVSTTAADWPTFLANGQRNGAGAGETMLTTANASQLVSKWTYKTVCGAP